MMTEQSVLEIVKDQQIKFIDFWFIDILGVVKSVTLPASQLERALVHGVSFDGSSMEGFTRVAESDMVLMPDVNTFAILPWCKEEESTARFICNVYTPQGEPFMGDPRMALVRVLQEAEQLGYAFKTGMEMEFFIFNVDKNNQPIIKNPYDNAGYFDLTTDNAQSLRRRMLLALDTLGVGVESTHSEIGYGQHEIDLAYTDALASADSVLTSRVALKTIARQEGVHCTFMPRPSVDLPGSGMHTYQSLHHIETDQNAFYDASHEYGLSEIARHFLAGQLQHARAMTAILAPLVNSYKRLGTSFEAPVYISWAHINRGALIRVPSVSAERHGQHTRLELRCPDPSNNPYLATAVMLKAGLDGIKRTLPLPDPIEETLLVQHGRHLRHVDVLPSTLGAALEALDQDEVILSALGVYIADSYMTAKQKEFEDYKHQVTRWELDHYLNYY